MKSIILPEPESLDRSAGTDKHPFLVALGVIAFFMGWISKHSFLPFVIYRVVLGTLLLVLLSLGVLQAY